MTDSMPGASIRNMEKSASRPKTETKAFFEIKVGVYCTEVQARRLVDEIQLLLCPDPEHNGPCPIPWTTAHWDLDRPEADATYPALVEQVRIEQGGDQS
ncbi:MULTISPECIES: hypothetical protein [unclassified Pseudonocardia]|uniref:hypothetical protein n=1 Tax=unclassified Pseudonocardia TaxID=2619320 RepID=UPI0001FFE6C2|nr:hypothetical protein [Pseudonocardia sp. Ae707_Ps1]OLM18215.1 hypothetical protein Ae707Ps1_2474 [Pseudonocardia sp. Ae707_Ps1]